MPIYDFACTSCGFKAELMRKISEPSLTVCPQCSKEAFAKMLSAPSFQLNGSGWYASDFKDKKTNNTGTVSEKSLDNSEAKTEAKTDVVDTKPAACNPGCACH
jgi:putative FmdB family regulatory protein